MDHTASVDTYSFATPESAISPKPSTGGRISFISSDRSIHHEIGAVVAESRQTQRDSSLRSYPVQERPHCHRSN